MLDAVSPTNIQWDLRMKDVHVRTQGDSCRNVRFPEEGARSVVASNLVPRPLNLLGIALLWRSPSAIGMVHVTRPLQP